MYFLVVEINLSLQQGCATPVCVYAGITFLAQASYLMLLLRKTRPYEEGGHEHEPSRIRRCCVIVHRVPALV
jgi:hypothetical protein